MIFTPPVGVTQNNPVANSLDLFNGFVVFPSLKTNPSGAGRLGLPWEIPAEVIRIGLIASATSRTLYVLYCSAELWRPTTSMTLTIDRFGSTVTSSIVKVSPSEPTAFWLRKLTIACACAGALRWTGFNGAFSSVIVETDVGMAAVCTGPFSVGFEHAEIANTKSTTSPVRLCRISHAPRTNAGFEHKPIPAGDFLPAPARPRPSRLE